MNTIVMGKSWMRRAALILIFVAMLTSVGSANAKAPDKTFGTWRNPKDTVHVRAEPCGKLMCGVVIWASEKAIEDARKGGEGRLVGSTLFRDFKKVQNGVWKGKVYVPDIGKTFSGTVTALDQDRLEGKGCLLGGIGCRSQVWTRMQN